MVYIKTPFIRRLFATLSGSSLPLDGKDRLKIYSFKAGRGFRLTTGAWHEEGANLAIIGPNHFNWHSCNIEESVRVLLQTLRPIPEIIVIGLQEESSRRALRLQLEATEFGCSSIEVSDPVPF